MTRVVRPLPLALAATLPFAASCVVDDVVGQRDAAPADAGPCDDTFEDPLSAGSLPPLGSEPQETSGFICPTGDADWYALDVPEGCRGVAVTLALAGLLSPVQPAFSVMACDEACLRAPGSGGAASCCREEAAVEPTGGGELAANLCLEPGRHFAVVHDAGDDDHDEVYPRGQYTLTARCLPETDAGATDCGAEG